METVRAFLRNEIGIFPDEAQPEGYAFGEFTGVFRTLDCRFRFRVVEARTRADAIGLYLALNAGGTPAHRGRTRKGSGLATPGPRSLNPRGVCAVTAHYERRMEGFGSRGR